MKKTIIALMTITSISMFAQKKCGFDIVMKRFEKGHPKEQAKRMELEKKLFSRKKNNQFKKVDNSIPYQGEIHEIPVVVHVIESHSASNKNYMVTDDEIRHWIDKTNKMYATTYGNGFFKEGKGANGGTVIPFKLTLAKRDPNCNPTTGIVRHNGSELNGYDADGVFFESKGVTEEKIRNFDPHWDENSYYNIYIIIGFDGNKAYDGVLGYAYYPSVDNSSYDTFMKASVVSKEEDSTLAHEFGHALGLIHPFGDADTDGVHCPLSTGKCEDDDDLVCDTERTASLLNTYPLPKNTDINKCTNKPFEGVQYNIMNYSFDPKKFTPGQRERALNLFEMTRSSLYKTSLALKSPSSDSQLPSLVKSKCAPKTIKEVNDYNIGATKVSLRNINNSSSVTNNSYNLPYYDFYENNKCSSSAVYTDLPEDEPSTITINIKDNNQIIKAWIDYNNNGIFENNELILNTNTIIGQDNIGVASATFTPPKNAIKNTYLRMRVIADSDVDKNKNTSCDNLNYGQAEDYAVRIIKKTKPIENSKIDELDIFFSKSTKSIILTSKKSKFGKYEIYDMSGRLIQSGASNTNEIKLLVSLSKGGYILKYENDNSFKFIY